jgi:hypothetical protein
MDKKTAIVLAILVLLSSSLVGKAYAVPAPNDDPAGNFTGKINGLSGSSCDTATGIGGVFATASAPDILFATLFLSDNTSSVTSFTIDSGLVSASPVTFFFRADEKGPTVHLFEYYAIVKSTVQNLGVTFATSASARLTCTLTAFSGIDPNNPFDSGAATPSVNSGNSTTIMATITTLSTIDTIVAFDGDCNGNPVLTSGWKDAISFHFANSSPCGPDMAVEDLFIATSNAFGQGYTALSASIGVNPAPWATIVEALTIPREGIVTGGCGLFQGGICNPAPVNNFTFQTSTVCPLVLGCYTVPVQLTGGQVSLLVTAFLSVALLSTLLEPRPFKVSWKRGKRDKRTSLV